MKFRILDQRTDENVLGGDVTEGNAYIAAYPRALDGYKRPTDLAIGEHSLCRYSLSGSSGIYKVLRVE